MKAFDNILHSRLLVKLGSYGVSGGILKWIECFLSNRQQRVVVEDQYSDWAPISSSVSQGSVLSSGDSRFRGKMRIHPIREKHKEPPITC